LSAFKGISMDNFLAVPGGRLAYSDVGVGPLIIAVPGMGDLRSTYRFLAPMLAGAGFRVVTLDVRGHGASSVSWDDYSVGAVAGDILHLIRDLDAGPAHVIGNSMAAGAAVIAAAREPQAIRSLTLVGPFVRDVMPAWLASAVFGPLLAGPWGAKLWASFFKRAFGSRLPDDFAEEAARRTTNLAEPGRMEAFRRMAVASKVESERCLANVTAPTLVIMGSRDADFPDPAKEAQHVAELLRGRAVVIDGAGHYPQTEMPDAVAAHVVPFMRSIDAPIEARCHAS
jgi:pimeloyl-ACP methyl ester carboxylesterase